MSADGTKAYRVLVADDHSIVRRGIRALLSSQPSLEVCGETATGLETIDAVKTPTLPPEPIGNSVVKNKTVLNAMG